MILPPAARTLVEMQPLVGGLAPSLLGQAIAGLRNKPEVTETWIPYLNDAISKYEIGRSLRRLAAFLGHIAHESGDLHRLEESLYYKSAGRINSKFGAIKTDAEAASYARNPERLANKVYANKNGNGNEDSGDGWRYRGRGLIQVTFKDNYRDCGRALGIDAVKHPELLATPKYAALSAGWFWKRHKLNILADSEHYLALSLRINKDKSTFHSKRDPLRKHALNVLCQARLGAMASVVAHFHR